MREIPVSAGKDLTKDEAIHLKDKLANGFAALKTGIAVSSKYNISNKWSDVTQNFRKS
jgi:hypothetical protein